MFFSKNSTKTTYHDQEALQLVERMKQWDAMNLGMENDAHPSMEST